MNRIDVVVGVDGSAPGREALRWAAAEAARRGSPLRVVHAYRPPWLVEEIATGTRLDTAVLAHAEKVLADAVEEARVTAPGLEVTGSTVCCHPVPLLMENAGSASLLVVGSRGHGGFGSVLLGSTGLQLATHATGPVVVVRGVTDRGNAPMIVGTDGSEQADVAVGAAFEAASVRGCFLTAIRAYPRAPGSGGPARPRRRHWAPRWTPGARSTRTSPSRSSRRRATRRASSWRCRAPHNSSWWAPVAGVASPV
jgi:nucleotide-binding universal stress UspA family protein